MSPRGVLQPTPGSEAPSRLGQEMDGADATCVAGTETAKGTAYVKNEAVDMGVNQRIAAKKDLADFCKTVSAKFADGLKSGTLGPACQENLHQALRETPAWLSTDRLADTPAYQPKRRYLEDMYSQVLDAAAATAVGPSTTAR